jgi:hypothetical protein
MKHLPLLLLACCALSAFGATEKHTYNARGFGRLRVSYERDDQVETTIFRTESPEKAVLTASKRKSDLLAFGDIKEHKDASLPGTLLELPGTGFWLLGTDGTRAYEFFAPSRDALQDAAPRGLQPVANRAYPAWMDGFDTYGPSIWVGGGGDQYQLPTDFEWLQKMKLGFCTLNPHQDRHVAPAILDTTIFDWHEAISKKYDIPYRQLLFPSYFEWAWNEKPLPYARPTPGFTGFSSMFNATDIITGGEQPIPEIAPYRWHIRRRLAQIYGPDTGLMGWHGCTEIPNANIQDLSTLAETPYIQKLYRDYLRKNLGLSLSEVGRRHFNDPKHFASWEDVTVPIARDFLGYHPQTSLDLAGVWEAHPDPQNVGVSNQWFLTQSAPADWIQLPSNDPVIILLYGGFRDTREKHFWMRRTFTVPMTDKTDAFRYLHTAIAVYHGLQTPCPDVWINGRKCDPLPASFSYCFDAGSLLRIGEENEIVVDTHGQCLPGYFFLNDVPLRPYPTMTEHENRYWYDAINFSAFLRVKKIEDDLRAIRSVDPVRPMKMMATINLLDLTTPMALRYGAYQHDTGGAAAYWCPMTGGRLARSHGMAWSCEQGGPPADAFSMRKHLSFYLNYGNDAVDFVFGVGHYTKKPDIRQWCEENVELFRTIGKLHLPQQPIAILRSSRATRLGFQEPWNWDFARGPLQTIGRTFVYIEVPDLLNEKLVDSYPILMDAGTVLLTDEEARAIRRYVKNGGVFLAQHHTGRHSPGKKDAWPLLGVFGLTGRDKAIDPGVNHHYWPVAKIRFEEDEDLFPALRGATIDGSGVAIDYLNKEHTGAVAVEGDSARAVARWTDDNSMAIAEVRLGKGRFVFLGSPFLTRMIDSNGVWANEKTRTGYLASFLEQFGSEEEARTGHPAVWGTRWESKNGVYDVYMATHMRTRETDEPVSVAPSFRRKTAPTGVVDIGTIGHPAVTAVWEDDFVTFPEETYEPMQTRLYAAPSASPGRSALCWIRNQAALWHPVETVRWTGPDITPSANCIALDDGWKLSEDFALESEFFTTEFDQDADWKTVRPGLFGTLGYPEDAKLLFRRTVDVPADWKDRTITLHFDANHWFWGLTPCCHLWVNGQPAPLAAPIKGQPNSAFAFPVEAPDGKVVLALSIDGSKGPPPGEQSIPHGISGLFYLKASPNPIRTIPLEAPWFACRDIGDRTEIKVGDKEEHAYFEIMFPTPDAPGKRIFLRSPASLCGIILNGHVVSLPVGMHELDVTRLLAEKENTLRWLPHEIRDNAAERIVSDALPDLELAIFDKTDPAK